MRMCSIYFDLGGASWQRSGQPVVAVSDCGHRARDGEGRGKREKGSHLALRSALHGLLKGARHVVVLVLAGAQWSLA